MRAVSGTHRLHILGGGIIAYTAAGGDVIRGRARWSLERQVRLVAGSLVLAGLALGLRLPTARLLSGGVGTGLVVSALTDTRCRAGCRHRAAAAAPREQHVQVALDVRLGLRRLPISRPLHESDQFNSQRPGVGTVRGSVTRYRDLHPGETPSESARSAHCSETSNMRSRCPAPRG
jgi:hypothetical protein